MAKLAKKTYTLDELKQMTPEQRANLYENARKHRDSGGQEIMKQLDDSGLSLSSGGMRMSDPAYIEMEEITWSTQGRKGIIEAVGKGLPALAGVEPLFVAALGDRYQPHDGGTVNAGYIVAGVMRHMGYTQDGEGKMPNGSVAKTAMKWKLRKR
jgi:hypothetical protein